MRQFKIKANAADVVFESANTPLRDENASIEL